MKHIISFRRPELRHVLATMTAPSEGGDAGTNPPPRRSRIQDHCGDATARYLWPTPEPTYAPALTARGLQSKDFGPESDSVDSDSR